MTIEEALERIRKQATVDLWPAVELALGLSRGSVYEAAIRGEIFNIWAPQGGGDHPCARKLGLEST